MKYKVCGKFGVMISAGAEDVTRGLDVEIDAVGHVIVTRGDGKQYATESDGHFHIPSAFLIDGRYTFTIDDVQSAAFIVSSGLAWRCVDSTYEEITNMWKAIAGLTEAAESAEKKAEEARAAVEEFRDGYRTE